MCLTLALTLLRVLTVIRGDCSVALGWMPHFVPYTLLTLLLPPPITLSLSAFLPLKVPTRILTMALILILSGACTGVLSQLQWAKVRDRPTPRSRTGSGLGTGAGAGEGAETETG